MTKINKNMQKAKVGQLIEQNLLEGYPTRHLMIISDDCSRDIALVEKFLQKNNREYKVFNGNLF
jgi:hypothetical protein